MIELVAVLVVVNTIVIIGVVYKLIQKREEHYFDQTGSLINKPVSTKAFAKPSGKRKPVLNDDNKAFEKENER